MGGQFWAHIAMCLFLCSVRVIRTDQDLAQELGLNTYLDVSKVNISQDEYTRMMNTYLSRLRESIDDQLVPVLQTFNADIKSRHQKRKPVTQLKFPKYHLNADQEEVEQIQLRLLMPPSPFEESPEIKLYQITGLRRRRFIGERKTYLSATSSKWCEFDVSSDINTWINSDSSFGLELQCPKCNNSLKPIKAVLNILVQKNKERVRRSSSYQNDPIGRTNCASGNNKQKCCRHNMNVSFKNLKVPQISSIIQPKSYEAGFCKGRCPYNYNHATNHSRIQSLVHKMDRKAVPRVCCAPSKLAPLDILRVDPYDSTKLNVEKWDNMRVLECACS